jgi:predicted metal-dependent hydrolase
MVTKNRERSLAHTLDYSLRESQRARNVTLKVNRTQGLVVVVPRHFDRELLPSIIESKRQWIERQLTKFDSLPGKFDCDWPPSTIDLPGAGLSVPVSYRGIAGDRLRLRHDCDHLQIGLPEDYNNDNLAALLIKWLRTVARTHCESVARELSTATGLSFSKVSVRAQKTRWGSYSSRGTLSLNYKLIFLPDHLLRHVILHELCHSVHMNHSQQFWALLRRVDPQATVHDEELNHAWKYLPAWLD